MRLHDIPPSLEDWNGGACHAAISSEDTRIQRPYPHIEELSGVRNQTVSNEVWIAALRWMLSQASLDAEPKRFEQSYKSTYNVAAWRALFRPYWLAKRRFPNWLPLTPKEEEYYLF
ncbi:MAG: hypothetical protein K2P70_15810 [Hyphomonadaceae bacterium]|nr:hypothetical protein [Hyphomonadaceae bacterium]